MPPSTSWIPRAAVLLAALAALSTVIGFCFTREEVVLSMGLGVVDFDTPGGQAVLQSTLELGVTFVALTIFLVAAYVMDDPKTTKLALWTYALVDIMAAIGAVAGPATGSYVVSTAVSCLILAAIFIASTFFVEDKTAEGYETVV